LVLVEVTGEPADSSPEMEGTVSSLFKKYKGVILVTNFPSFPFVPFVPSVV